MSAGSSSGEESFEEIRARTVEQLRSRCSEIEQLLEHVAASIEREFVQERELIARPDVQRRVETVQKLLAGEPVDQAELDRLGYRLHAHWHLGVIATGDDAGDVLLRLRTNLERRVLLVPCEHGVIWGWLGGQRKLAVRELERLLSASSRADFRLVIGEPGSGLDGWRQTHREARDAFLAALRKPDKLVRYADTPLFAAAVQNDTLTRWLRDFLAPLRGQKDGGVGLLQTLRALINVECNRRAAAALLDIDRHTVENRLRTAEELLGRSLTTCLPELDTALRLAELDGAIAATRTPPRPSIAPPHSAHQHKTRTSHRAIRQSP